MARWIRDANFSKKMSLKKQVKNKGFLEVP
jgi:hypothetical protein